MSAVRAADLACHARPDELALEMTQGVAVDLLPVVAIVGRPNVGKSTFFAKATGRYAEASNVPGTTVGVARRQVRVGGRNAVVVDLPGALSLVDGSAGLPPFWQLLGDARPDAILAVVDLGDLARHLPLVLACRDLGMPIVVAANLADEAAARGVTVDVGRLSQLLAAPVYRTIGREGVGVGDAVAAAVKLAAAGQRGAGPARRARPAPPYAPDVVARINALARKFAAPTAAENLAGVDPLRALVERGQITPIGAATIVGAEMLEPARWVVAEGWAAQVEQRRGGAVPLADRLAQHITAPWPGLPLFLLVTVLTIGLTIAVGTLLSGVLGSAWASYVSPTLTSAVNTLVPVPPVAKATLWAVDSGLLAMLSVGIPFVLVFYVLLAVLEDSGYLASAAVLSDRVFNAFGLPGRAAIPILAATGCNVPAIYGTRVLESRRERLLASFLIVLTPCSARSAVVVAALAPFAGAGVALAAFGVVGLVAVGAGIGANALVPGRQSPLVLELPPLRRPIARLVAAKAWYRFRSFVRTATPVMLVGSFVLGLAYETGAIGPIESAIGPSLKWLLGLPAVAGIALVLSFLRKELALQLLLVLAIAELGQGASSLGAFMSPGQLFVYAIATAVSIPCAATLASLVDEFGKRAALAVSAATLLVGLGAAAVVARLIGVA